MHKFREQADRPLERQAARIDAFFHPTQKTSTWVAACPDDDSRARQCLKKVFWLNLVEKNVHAVVDARLKLEVLEPARMRMLRVDSTAQEAMRGLDGALNREASQVRQSVRLVRHLWAPEVCAKRHTGCFGQRPRKWVFRDPSVDSGMLDLSLRTFVYISASLKDGLRR